MIVYVIFRKLYAFLLYKSLFNLVCTALDSLD